MFSWSGRNVKRALGGPVVSPRHVAALELYPSTASQLEVQHSAQGNIIIMPLRMIHGVCKNQTSYENARIKWSPAKVLTVHEQSCNTKVENLNTTASGYDSRYFVPHINTLHPIAMQYKLTTRTAHATNPNTVSASPQTSIPRHHPCLLSCAGPRAIYSLEVSEQ
jgi:hypothetical protein